MGDGEADATRSGAAVHSALAFAAAWSQSAHVPSSAGG